MLASVTPAFSSRIYLYTCPVFYKGPDVYGENIVVLSVLAILGFDIACATVLIKGLFVKNIYLRIFLIWLVFSLSFTLAISLLTPLMIRDAFVYVVKGGHIFWI